MTGLALPLLTAIIGVVIGGVLTHVLSVRRDVAVKRREIILSNLMCALEELEKASPERPDSDLKQLEKVVSRLNMVGDRELVRLSDEMVMNMNNIGRSNNTPLYNALRTRIRRELNLPSVSNGYVGLVIRYPGDKGFDEAKKVWLKDNVGK